MGGLLAAFADLVERAGYGLVQSPCSRRSGCSAGMGEGTDVVRKEMYDFLDKGGRHLALRPEGTASVVRAFVQHRPADRPGRSGTPPRASATSGPRPTATASTTSSAPRPSAAPTPTSTSRSSPCCRDFYRLARAPPGRAGRSTPSAPPPTAAATSTAAHASSSAASTSSTPDDHEKVEAHPMRVLDSKRAEQPGRRRPTPRCCSTACRPRPPPTSSGCRRA